jgi:hypothetical protein
MSVTQKGSVNLERFSYHGTKKKVFLYELDKRFIGSLAPHLRRTVEPVKAENSRHLVSKSTMSINLPDWNPELAAKIGLTDDEESVNRSIVLVDSYLKTYESCFKHIAQIGNFILYILGLLSDLARKSIEPMALKIGGPEYVRALQKFIQIAPVDDNKLLRVYQTNLSKAVACDNGMFTIDGTDFPKKG